LFSERLSCVKWNIDYCGVYVVSYSESDKIHACCFICI